jgi:hypothetical protein
MLFGASLVPSAPGAAVLTYSTTLEPHQVVIDAQSGGAVVQVSGYSYHTLIDEGLPALPYRIVSFILPQGEAVEHVEFTVGDAVVLREDVRVKSAPPAINNDGALGQSSPLVENTGDRFPGVDGKYLGTGYLHGYAIASVAVFPLSTENSRLTLTPVITIEVTTEPATPEIDVVTRQRHRDGFRSKVESQLASYVVNADFVDGYHLGDTRVETKPGGFQPTSFPSLEGSAVDYVIITNDSLAAAYQTLADWKTDKGVPTVIRTTEWIEANYRNGSDLPETIRNFIKDAYAKWGITYVLIGGDVEQVPVRLAQSCFSSSDGFDLPVDLYYACLDGDWNADHDPIFGEMPGGQCPGDDDQVDLYAEVYVGRLPSRSPADVNLITSKIISYETPYDTSFTNKILLMAEVLFPIDWDPGETVNLNGADLAQFLQLTTMTDPGLQVTKLYETEWLYTGSIHEDHATAVDSLDSGFDHVIHVGHGFRFNMSVGDRSVMNTDADVMTNGDRLSNFYLLNCTAVAFTYFCLAEHFLLSPAEGFRRSGRRRARIRTHRRIT